MMKFENHPKVDKRVSESPIYTMHPEARYGRSGWMSIMARPESLVRSLAPDIHFITIETRSSQVPC
jgi:hypothetical protein